MMTIMCARSLACIARSISGATALKSAKYASSSACTPVAGRRQLRSRSRVIAINRAMPLVNATNAQTGLQATEAVAVDKRLDDFSPALIGQGPL